MDFPHFQAELIDPAVKGTLNVLRSCAKVPSIRRVIITSSLKAVVFTGKPLTDDVVVYETWFSDPVFCETSKVCKCVIKLLLFIYLLPFFHGLLIVVRFSSDMVCTFQDIR